MENFTSFKKKKLTLLELVFIDIATSALVESHLPVRM